MKVVFSLFIGCIISLPVMAGDWVNDWFDQSASGGSTRYQTQQRGYYSAGSFSGRWRLKNDYLVSATPPSIEVGCGGIDLFGGGFTYLDPEYLVEKFERIVQAAPAFAFEIALQEFCKPCVAAMETLEDITTQLNGIQLNECEAARQLASAVMSPGEAYRNARTAASNKASMLFAERKNSQDHAEASRSNGGKPPDPTIGLVEQCPDVFKQVFANGSVVDRATELVGFHEYAPLLRGLVGDVFVKEDDEGKNFETDIIPACSGNDQISADDFLKGTFEIRGLDGDCNNAGYKSLIQMVSTRLESIAAKIVDGSAQYSAAEMKFIDEAPIPLLPLLRDAAIKRTTDEALRLFTDPLAHAYSHRILTDLYNATRAALSTAEEISVDMLNSPSVSGAGHCDVSFLRPAISHVEAMNESTIRYRAMAHANYQRANTELLVSLQIAQQLYNERVKLMQGFGHATD